MIYSNINNNWEGAGYSKLVERVFSYLKKNDFEEVEPGIYELAGKDIYAQVFDAVSKPINETKQEFHKEYVDFQYWVSGSEYFGVTTKKSEPQIISSYEEKDLYYCVTSEDESLIKAEKGDVIVVFPNDIHRPGITLDESKTYRKVVVKVRASLFKGEAFEEKAEEKKAEAVNSEETKSEEAVPEVTVSAETSSESPVQA